MASVEELAYLIGADIHVITERLKQDFGLENYDTEELIRVQRTLFNERFYREKLTPMDGLEGFLESLKKEGILLAVVSSSGQDYVEYVLDRLRIREYFNLYRRQPAVPSPSQTCTWRQSGGWESTQMRRWW